MQHNLSILIRGGNLINKGAEAMLLTVVNRLRHLIPSISFYVFPLDTERGMYIKFGINELNYGCTRFDIMSFFMRNFFKTFPLYLKYRKINTINQITICKDLHGVIDISGYNYGDYWGISGVLNVNIWLTEFNSTKNKFYIFMPQAFGPFKNPGFRPLFDSFFDLASLICARDNESLKYLQSAAPSKASNAKLEISPDIVFSFKYQHKSIVSTDTDKVIIGYAPNVHIKHLLQANDSDASYADLICSDLMDITSGVPGCEIRLISTEIYPSSGRYDDSNICKEIAAACNLSNVTYVDGYSAADRVYDEIGTCNLLVGSRYHSLIFALSQNIPVIAIGWSHKYDELMNLFDLNNYIIDPSLIGKHATINKIISILNNTANIRNKIQQANYNISIANQVLFEKVSNIIGEVK
jgi:colanic acid/amylovoran biosynthesis protein